MRNGTGGSASDRELVGRIVADGDHDAFLTLYRRHTPYLLQFVVRMLGGSDVEAEDVVQDTWTRAIRGLPEFRWSSQLRTWLTGIALNRAREELRRAGRRRKREVSGHDEVRAAEPPSRVPDRLDLERAIAALPDGYRTVLVLHDVEGFTHDEIGGRLGIAAGTSRSQLFHARRLMRAALSAADGPATAEGSNGR